MPLGSKWVHKLLNVNVWVKIVTWKASCDTYAGFYWCWYSKKISKFHWALSGISMVKIKLNCLYSSTERLEREIFNYKMDFHITPWDVHYISFILLFWVTQLQCLQLRTQLKGDLPEDWSHVETTLRGDQTISFLRVCLKSLDKENHLKKKYKHTTLTSVNFTSPEKHSRKK